MAACRASSMQRPSAAPRCYVRRSHLAVQDRELRLSLVGRSTWTVEQVVPERLERRVGGAADPNPALALHVVERSAHRSRHSESKVLDEHLYRLAQARLLTLIGTGGTGKTRLGLEVARDAVADYADGVWLVELGALADPALVAPGVAAVLGVHASGELSPVMLATALRDRATLLVLGQLRASSHCLRAARRYLATHVPCDARFGNQPRADTNRRRSDVARTGARGT